MQGWKRHFALVLAAVMMLCTTAFAADVAGTKWKITDKTGGSGVTALFTFADNEESIQLTISGANIQAGEEYLVLMMKGDSALSLTDENNILYIYQAAASGGTLSFKVYPESMEEGTIWLTGSFADGSSAVKVATVKEKSGSGGEQQPGDQKVPGDLTGDDVVNLFDVIELAKVVKSSTLGTVWTAEDLARYDLTKDGIVNLFDVIELAKIAKGV